MELSTVRWQMSLKVTKLKSIPSFIIKKIILKFYNLHLLGRFSYKNKLFFYHWEIKYSFF